MILFLGQLHIYPIKIDEFLAGIIFKSIIFKESLKNVLINWHWNSKTKT